MLLLLLLSCRRMHICLQLRECERLSRLPAFLLSFGCRLPGTTATVKEDYTSVKNKKRLAINQPSLYTANTANIQHSRPACATRARNLQGCDEYDK